MVFIIPIISKAQCTVTKDVENDGTITYSGLAQSIYRNDDLENGIQTVYLQMIVLQKEKNSSLLKFALKISNYSKGGKPEISPRVLEFTFVDGTVLQLKAIGESQSNLMEISGNTYRMNINMFQFKLNDYTTFQKTNIASIKIIDGRTNGGLISNRNGDVMLKQSNCIGEAIN